MIWPSAQDYNEAVQNPSTSFADPDLRSGTVESNRLGLPKVMSGAFASVYRVDSGATPWAVRCFLNCRPDQEERYKLISDFVLFDDLDCTVPFYYLEKGIKWKGNWYPILKMEWVEGPTLEKFLDENFNKKNVILELLKQFDELILDLNRAGIAHGDLQHGNIIVTENGLRLVDYDALYVPALEGLKSPEVGHPNFQHPLRSASHFDPGVDNFSAWLIHFSLLAISIDSELYRLAEGGDDSILFKRSDFQDPQRSELFRILVEHPATELRQAGLMLAAMLAIQPTAVPALSAGADELALLPDMTILFQQEIGEDGIRKPLIQNFNSSGDDYAERISKLLPQSISRVPTGNELIVREAHVPDSLYRPKQNMRVKLALAHRNIDAKIRTASNTWFLRRFPQQWCIRKLKQATSRFEQESFESAVPIYIELADILELLANERNFWKGAVRQLAKHFKFLVGVSLVVVASAFAYSWRGWLLDSLLFAIFVSSVLAILNASLESRLRRKGFEPEKLLVEVNLSLGYCYCFINQWRVASNFYMMALRACKWGIDPELRKRSLLLYAVCRNEGGDRKDAIRFLLQKPEVMETLPSLVESENRGHRLTRRLPAFHLFYDLGQHYVHLHLILSAVPPLLAAKKIFQELSAEDQAQSEECARELFLTLAYIYTIRADWTSAQSCFNDLIDLCNRTNNREFLCIAEICAALSANLRSDLTGATALMLRSNYQLGDLLRVVVEKESVAHKILFYDRSRGVAFLQELGVKLKDGKRFDQLMEVCSILMYMFRRSVTPTPLFTIGWFDQLDEEFIAECFRRTYFDNRQPTTSELSVLIDAIVSASLTKSVLILGQAMLKDNMLDKVDYLLNRMATISQLNRLMLQEEPEVEERLDRFFIEIVLRIATDQFKEIVSRECVSQFGSVLQSEEMAKITVKTLIDCILRCEDNEHKTASDIIYGAFDSPSIFKNEYLHYRGILRFIELFLAKRLATFHMYADSLVLYDRLEGYYSANIDRVLRQAMTQLEKSEQFDAKWLEDAVSTSQQAFLYRGGASSQQLVEIRQLVAVRMSSQFSTSDQIANWQCVVSSVHTYARASFAVLDTICDTAMKLFQQNGPGSRESTESTAQSALVANQICQFMLSVAIVYLEHDASQQVTKHLAALVEHDDRFNERVTISLRLFASILLRKNSVEREAAATLAGVISPSALLQDLLAEQEPAQTLLRSAGIDAVDLFVQAGDMERDDQSRSRQFYLGAAFVYNALPLSLANRVLSQKLSERLGDLPNSANIRAELSAFQQTDAPRRVDTL